MSTLPGWVWAVFMFGGLALLLIARFPIGVALLTVSVGGAMLLFGPGPGLEMAVIASVSSVSSFTLVAIPLFILMGEILFRSGLMLTAIAGLDRTLSRLKGRLAFLAVFGGGLMGVLSGSAVASTAVLGGSLVPEMQRRGYSPRLASGSILAAGGLAMVLPPSAIVIIWGSTAGVPVGPLLMAGVLPGILMAVGYTIVVRIWLARDPRADHGYAEEWKELAVVDASTSGKAPVVEASTSGKAPVVDTGTLRAAGMPTTVVTIADDGPPRGEVIFANVSLVAIVVVTLGSILLGIATPSESAAIGVMLTLIAALLSRKLTWASLYRSLTHALLNTGMVFFLVIGASIYARVMSGSGLVRSFVDMVTSISDNSIVLVILMVAIVILLGLFLESISLLLITIPLFMPIISTAGIDPLVFGIAMIIAIQVGTVTPPIGMSLFVMRKFMPLAVPMRAIYTSVLPFLASDLLVIALVFIFPALATWIPSIL